LEVSLKRYFSSENLFKPSNRKDCRGVVLAEGLKKTGISIEHDQKFFRSRLQSLRKEYLQFGQSVYFDRRNITENSRETETAHEKTEENNN